MIGTIRGFRDLLPEESAIFSKIENIAREIFKIYCYHEMRIPTVEYNELFVKSTGETTDIVEKEMYVFKDQSDRVIALRPEGTPGIARAFINHNLGQKMVNPKFYYIANMFRAEKPQAGRFREFEQIGIERIGDSSYYSDAETIVILNRILTKTGLENFRIEINSIGCFQCREKYREELLNYLKSKKNLCIHCQKRMERNPLRVLDCKVDAPNLKNAPEIKLCTACLDHYNGLKNILKETGINYTENKFLVRGLDYYTRTVFEVKSKNLGSQDAIAAGGRYDNLIKSMGGGDYPSVGWALGLDRLAILINKETENLSLSPSVFIVCIDKKYADYCFLIANEIRNSDISCDFSSFLSSPKSQMRSANKSKAKIAVIVGESEFSTNSCTVKNMETQAQTLIKREELINFLRKNL